MRRLLWLAALACGVGFAVVVPAPTASADSCDCDGWQYYAAGRSCVNVCPGNANYDRRWRRGGRRVRPRGFARIRPALDSDYRDYHSAERAIRERGRVAAYAVQEQSWRLWHRPTSVYGPPPTGSSNVRSLLVEERSAELPGTFCVEGEVAYPKPATPEALAFCRKGR